MKNDIEELLNKINIFVLQEYLTGKGWQKTLSKKEDRVFFRQSVHDKVLEILLPLNRDFSDYQYAIRKALHNIAISENRDETQVLNDLLLPPADTIRFRVNNSRTQEGLISLSEGFMLLESAKKSLFTIACDIVKPESYHKRLGFKDAQQFIDACMLGQTERGSFIASIVCPIGNQSTADTYTKFSLFEPIETLSSSFTRRITQRLMLSIHKVKQAIESQNYGNFEDDNDFIISANFLESLIEMGEYGDNEEIQIYATWAPTIPVNEDIPSSITLTKDYILPLERIVDRIKEKNADQHGEFIGKISQVKADPDPSARKDGEVTFNFIGDTGVVKAKVTLIKDDFEKALEAFERGENIRIKGILKSSGRTKWIENPEFGIIK